MSDTCNHSAHMPTFDETAARTLVAKCIHARGPLGDCHACTAEIRKRWPRYFGACLTCGADVILYASPAHFVYGDW